MPLDNKISNIIGTKLPQWVLNQLETRANKNTQDSRDNDNILYLTNKSAWVRLVSSVNIANSDLLYFKNQVGANLETDNVFGFLMQPDSLAKQYVLFGGTSKYLNKNSYGLRSGINKDGAYGMLGKNEVQQFGYKPMPGITNVTIDTQGRLGSVRSATINFKCWDKSQLDIIDALYFKLGFTMFLEWGHTYFYYSGQNTEKRDPNKVVSTELYSIDPFEKGLNKEDIQLQIAKNSRNTEGNYDAMLGIVTNFNFTYTQDGGYDCSIRLMGLGVLGDSIKINNSGTLPALLIEEILQLNNTLLEISNSVKTQQELDNQAAANKKAKYPECVRKTGEIQTPPQNRNNKERLGPEAILGTVNNVIYYFYPDGRYQTSGFSITGKYECKNNQVYIDGNPADPSSFTYQEVLEKSKNEKPLESSLQERYYLVQGQGEYDYFAIDKVKNLLPIDSDKEIIATLNLANIEKLPPFSFTGNSFVDLLLNAISKTRNDKEGFIGIGSKKFVPLNRRDLDQNGNPKPVSTDLNSGVGIRYTATENLQEGTFGNENYSVQIEYSGLNKKGYLVKLQYENEPKFEAVSDAFIKNRLTTTRTNIFQDAIKSAVVNTQTNWKITSVENTNFGLFIAETDIEVINNQIVRKKTGTGPTGESIFQDVSENVKYTLTLKLTFNDLSILSNFSITDKTDLISPKDAVSKVQVEENLTNQNVQEIIVEQSPEEQKKALETQVKQSLNYQSTLEIMLRTIQVHALNKAINDTNKDLEIGRTTYVLNIADPYDKIGNKTFLKQIFSTGVFSTFIDELVKDPSNKLSDLLYDVDKKMVPQDRFRIQSKYGFASSLLGNKESIEDIPKVNFEELLKAYVVPYQINQEIVKGTYTNHPVYIPLGLLLMILNHACTIYDTKNEGKDDFQTPLVYIDFNPETNFCLTNAKQLSTDPWKCLIPFQGGFNDYISLFDRDILINGGAAIQPTSGSTQSVPLFNPDTDDKLSGALPKIKFGTGKLETTGEVYRGKMMNILLNIDYLVELAQQNSYKDGTNSVYLKTFIEQILNGVNKSLGNFNIFRLSYNDSANTFQIVDDQFVPSLSNEEQVTPKNNTTELPLAGKFSIAKNLEIKSEVSSKLANMLAISANANSQNKATLSTNGDSFGFINTSYVDRYIPNRGEISGSNIQKNNNDTLKISAAQFNMAISDFYSKINPSQTSVSHATNYYIEKMAVVKNNEYATRASAMIPVSVNFTTDGISGLSMGQAFTVPDILLPYTYTTRKIPGAPQDHLKNVGFAVVGLTHTIENNQWNTAVRANMIYLKDKTEFTGSVVKVDTRTGQFGINEFNQDSSYINPINVTIPSGEARKNLVDAIIKTSTTTGIKMLALAQTIVEGYYPNTAAYKNNNPGNIRSAQGPFRQFSTLQEGAQAMVEYINRAVNKTNRNYANANTLAQYINVYAPSEDNNDPNSYIASILGYFKKVGVNGFTANSLMKDIAAFNQNVNLS